MINTYISLITFVVALIVVIYLLKTKRNLNIRNTEIFNSKTNAILLILIGITVVLYFYKLGSVPRGLHVDEAGTILDAINITNYGVDRYQIQYPVYFWNFGGGQNALMTYIDAVWLKILPFNPIYLPSTELFLFVMRFPATLLNIIAYICLYKIFRFKYNTTESLLGLLIAMILPFSIMHSRWILESYLLFPMYIISLYLLILSVKKNNNIFYFLSGASFGLTLYTYAISYLIVSISLVVFLIYFIKLKTIKISNVICFFIPLFFLGLPLFILLLMNSGIINRDSINYFGFTIAKLPTFRISEVSFSNIMRNLADIGYYTSFLYDYLGYNAYKDISTIFYFNIPILFFGIIVSLKNMKKTKHILNIDFLVLVTFISTIFVSLLIYGNNVNKLNLVYFPMIFYIVTALINIKNISPKALTICLTLTAISFSAFALNYYNDNNIHMIFEDDYIDAVKEVAYLNTNEKTIYIDKNIVINDVYFILFYNLDTKDYFEEDAPFENMLSITNVNIKKVDYEEPIDEKGIYIAQEYSDLYNKLYYGGFEHIKRGDYFVFHKQS